MMFFKSLYHLLIEPFRRSFRNRLILIMIFISVSPLIFAVLLATDNTRKSMETEVIQSNLSQIAWSGGHLEEKFTQLNNLINTILISPHLNEYMINSDSYRLVDQFTAQRNIINTITSVYYSGNSDLLGIKLYLHKQNRVFVISDMQDDIKYVTQAPDLLERFFLNNIDFSIVNGAKDGESFYLVRRVNRFENRELLGGVMVEVKWRMLNNIMELLDSEKAYTVLIADQQGEVMFSNNKDEPSSSVTKLIHQTGPGPGYIQNDDYYVFYNTIQPWGLKLIKIIPTELINQSANRTLQYGLIIGLLSIMVSILIAIIVAWRTSKPIVNLARSMSGFNLINNTNVQLSNRVDEIGLLELNLVNMSRRIREHIQTEYIINLEKRTAQLRALQAQINPHSLQNTLQLIGSMAFSKAPQEIYDVIRSLSQMFRYVVRDPNELVTIQTEIDYLNNYLYIQKQRFESRIHSSIELDSMLTHCKIPKLTLLPIVENAFQHGLEKKSSDWVIKVSVQEIKDGIEIRVEDNGVGMNSEKLEELRARLHDQLDQVWATQSIGLGNVAARLQLHFGSQYGIEVDSQIDVGTIVMVRIPIVKDR